MKKTPIYLILMATLLASCFPEKKTVTKTVLTNGNSGSNTTTPTVGPTATPTVSPTSDSSIDYIVMSDRVVHGKNSGTVVWNSNNSNHTGGIDPRAFSTDQKLYIQIVPRYDSRYSADVDGNFCNFNTLKYDKLKFKVRVASVEAPGQGASCNFTANVDSASSVIQLSVPTGSAYPPVIEISNVEHDWTCKNYCVSGQTSNVSQCQNYYCPYYLAGANDCVAFDIRIATDETKSLPGTIKNCGE